MTPIVLVLTLFCVVLGGIFGSFLNVVIWRLPGGMSLVSPGSFCPKCKHSIRFFDNIPVFGWIFLRGRCRDCHAPISFRYPLVEGICALIAAGLFLAIVALGWTPGMSSPLFWSGMSTYQHELAQFLQTQTDRQIDNPEMSLYNPAWFEYLVRMSCGLTAMWSLFFFLILTMALIQFDGNKTPVVFYYIMIGLICVICKYTLFLWTEMTDDYAVRTALSNPVQRLILACVTGVVFGIVGWLFVTPRQRLDWFAVCLLTAFYFGGIRLPRPDYIAFFALTIFGACFLNMLSRTIFKRSYPLLFLFVTLVVGVALTAFKVL
ncbi:MAG: prepilin peptidase [Thermoguttaceae bacterium]|nr:prepilin peptidase [Thermoguttaceae bacterium]